MNGITYTYQEKWLLIGELRKNIAFGYQHSNNDADDASRSN